MKEISLESLFRSYISEQYFLNSITSDRYIILFSKKVYDSINIALLLGFVKYVSNKYQLDFWKFIEALKYGKSGDSSYQEVVELFPRNLIELLLD